MVFLTVDEAAAFDALSIIFVKQQKLQRPLYAERERLMKELVDQIGDEKYSEVISSPEFTELSTANEVIWDLVAKAANDEVAASTVVKANNERYRLKRKLQGKWFRSELEEVKG